MHHHYLPASPKGSKVASMSLSRSARSPMPRHTTAKRTAFAPSRPAAGSRNNSSMCASVAPTPVVPRPPKRSPSPSAAGATGGALVHKTRYAWLSLSVRCAATRHQWQRVQVPVPRTSRGRASLVALSLLYVACARAVRQQLATEVDHLLGRDFGDERDATAAERKARSGAEALACSLGREPAAPAAAYPKTDEGDEEAAEGGPKPGDDRWGTWTTKTTETAKPRKSARFSTAVPRDEDGEEMPPNPSGEPRAQWVIANQGARARAHFASLQAERSEAPGEGAVADGKAGADSSRPRTSRRESEWEDEAERDDFVEVEFGF